MKETNSDIVIVGSGVAGLSAAVTALQAGLSVTVVERAPLEDFGGNSRWTDAYVRMKNESEISDDFEETFAANAGTNLDPNVLIAAGSSYHDWPDYVKAHPFTDPEIVSQFANHVPQTVAWLKTLGVKFEPHAIYHLTQNTTRLAASGGGLAIIERLAEEAKALGATVLYRTCAIDLVIGDDGAVTGILATDPDGKRKKISARSIVLASGGYQGNLEMLTHYMGKRAVNIRPVARGGYYNKGEGIRMALKAGAAPAGDFGSYHAEPMDPRSKQAGPVIFIYPYGILVNKAGARFLDEAPGTSDASYDEITRTIADQKDGLAYVIFDSKVEGIPRWRTSIRSEVPAIEAPTLERLIEKLGLPIAETTSTIAAYNAACGDSGTWDPVRLDGLATSGLVPRKSNWSLTIDKPPFMAFPIISGNCFTFGGLKVNSNAQVLDSDGKAMRGLYAAGETVGLYHQVYTGSTSVLRGLVFGRLAATHAAGRNEF
ncbi:fumarate reductase [Bradyrhizobium sp. LTSP885]|uniref:FAD-dependent oxidoreductase n=1 Tax=Bradyrhizobium sp. LTSP885 TaxID=1619232 RepID=UPI0005C917A2|nr:FAD-dependent oxidoreductase [Bradyrhizobium sp. LTSP885]KJC50463.1 fumarate reductase [Bradyrhizobium sp. LTSP885]